MAFITTNPSPFIVNIPELQNVQTSATGLDNTLTTVSELLGYINTANASASVNTIGAFNTTSVNVTSDLNLSNTSITFLGSNLLNSNAVNGPAGYLAFQVADVEYSRLTPTGLGIKNTAPITELDVAGSALIRGALYISTMGLPATSTLGNLYADGDLFATGIKYPSDPALKRNIVPYELSKGLPEAKEFIWKANNVRDIGVMADEVAEIEPACVNRRADGTLTVDYPKLTVLLLAEVKQLKKQMQELQAKLS